MSILFQPHPFKFGLTVHRLLGGLQVLPVIVLSSTPFSVQANPIVPLPPAKIASHSSLTESISKIEAISTSLQPSYTARDLLPLSEPSDFDQIIRQLTPEEDASPWQVADAVPVNQSAGPHPVLTATPPLVSWVIIPIVPVK